MLPGALVAALFFGGRKDMSVLHPAGPQAWNIHDLFQIFFWVTLVIYVVTLVFFTISFLKRRRPEDPEAAAIHKRGYLVVGLASTASVIVLFVLLSADLRADHRMASFAGKNPVTIEVTGNQWWWQVRYIDPVPANIVMTANEIHVPVGRPVVLLGRSHDVIHSFWAPNIHGKRDLIPGYENAMWFQVDQPGTFRGQCAEFCGLQHAHMAFYIVAQEPKDFENWMAAQREPAQPPQTDEQRQGMNVFLANDCIMCHTIRGTDAAGTVGPDLTHLASRGNIAAGTLPFTPGALAGWILDPQTIKPGNKMPQHALSGDDMQALLAYLQSLK